MIWYWLTWITVGRMTLGVIMMPFMNGKTVTYTATSFSVNTVFYLITGIILLHWLGVWA